MTRICNACWRMDCYECVGDACPCNHWPVEDRTDD